MTTQEQIAVMQAFADGKEIEFCINAESGDRWFPVKDPGWNWFHYTFRVKPRVPRRIWLEEYSNGCHAVFSSKESASGLGKLTEFVEVIK